MLRRISLSRLLLLCALIVAVGASATAIAVAVDAGPTPPVKPLAVAVHDALAAPAVQGVSANIVLTNRLLEGANLASGGAGGGLTSNPLITGASGRLWIANDGRVRLELQSEKGDSELYYDGHTVQLYDGAAKTLYRYTPPADQGSAAPAGGEPAADPHEVPTVAKIEEAISKLSEHVDVSDATPTNVAGQPAYTVRVSPKEGGSLLGGAELSFDAAHGTPLRAAIYSSTSSAPVIELAATEISYGPVADSVFAFDPPAGVKVDEISGHVQDTGAPTTGATEKPTFTTHGNGVTAIGVLEDKSTAGAGSSEPLEGLPQVKINGISASELSTELGTVLSFERSGVRYVVAGALPSATIEAFARGL